MRYAHLGMVLFAAACGSSSKSAELVDAGGGIDGGDGTSNPGCTSFVSLEAIDTCELRFDDDLTITGMAQYDTDLQVLTQGNTTIPIKHKLLTVVDRGVESILVRNLTIMSNQELRITGSLPIAILASGNVTLMTGARIDVSNGGAGGRPLCGQTVGGGGGGLGAAGGNGGDSDTHGPAVDVPTKVLRGGCPGVDGASSTIDGKGGASGGALHLATAGRIELASGAAIDAGGGPGRGGARTVGGAFGGGGGSGGMLMLEAPHIIGPNATITANGGGGGGGGDGATSGGDGSQGTLSAIRASGGTGAVAGGRGGSRDAPTGENAAMATETSRAGGGGGVGIIRIKSADKQLGLISPAPQ